MLHLLPECCRSGQACWRSSVPLICFYIIEWHHPDRCLRQFSINQPIPSPPNIDDKLHSIDLHGQTEHDWNVKMLPFIHEWNIRSRHVVNAPLLMEPLHHRFEYMQWYTRHTRR